MRHEFLTIIAPLSPDRIAEAAAIIETLGNPATPGIAALFGSLDAAGNGIHFASLHAIASADGKRGYLLLECSADLTQQAAINQLVMAATYLRPVFQFSTDWRDGNDFSAYLTSHVMKIGTGWLDNPGLPFAGTPEFSVGRILAEETLRAHIAPLVAKQSATEPALARLNQLRAALASDPKFSPMLQTPPPALESTPPSVVEMLPGLALSFTTKYLWPLVLIILLGTIGVGIYRAHHASHWLGAFLGGAAMVVTAGLIITLLLVAAVYLRLRALEATDNPSDRQADRATNEAMFVRENRCAQNHMISITERKPGLVRQFTSRAMFWIIGELASRGYYPPGFLSDIGSIHFARWVTVPHTPDLIFLSNYGGSWESYLEDFITLAHAGLTGVWSNTIGFPRSENLINKGATDGERFKRYARQSMVPTRFWFSAYPHLTTSNIRTNGLIRRGLAAAMTEDEALRWLALFGSAARPTSALVNNDIQSLVLGGLGFLDHGACLLCTLPKDVTAARHWLQQLSPHIAYNDGRRITRDAVITLGLTAQGLARLGLPEDASATFPFTFLEGMATETRARMLGDTGASDPSQWSWNAANSDAVLLVYGRTQQAVDGLAAQINEFGADYSTIPLRPIQTSEPFGFADGISQPVIRGTHKALRSGDPLHLVEPGEFLLGYPDNHGNLPPGPTLAATDDPANLLPLLTPITDFNCTKVETRRDLGFNGSYLVIRQLEQDTTAFDNYCKEQAADPEVAAHFNFPVTPEFVGAKLVGRWQDGSPIVRHATHPPHELKQIYDPHNAIPRKMSMMHGAARVTPAAAAASAQATLAAAQPTKVAGGAVKPPIGGSHHIENDFLFGTEDPQGLRCPFGAHIRRANPRDSLNPGSTEQIAITNRHRIIRVGRQFEPKPGQNPGLLFMCLNGDIERQFEFLQQTWIGNTSFHGLIKEGDPLLGTLSGKAAGFTIPTASGPACLKTLPDFVTVKGGGYFFIPGRRLVEYLCQPI